MNTQALLGGLRKAVIEGDDTAATDHASKAVAAAIEPMTLVREAINPAMEEVGAAFENGTAFLPELILAGDAARAALDVIIPAIAAADLNGALPGTVVIGTVFGDAHDIGKNIVSAILAAHGVRIVDLGINVTPKEYIEAALQEKADVIAMSSVITTSLPYQREVIRTLVDRGLREQFFVIVGGGPVTAQWAADISADGYGRDARDAAVVVQHLLDDRTKGLTPPRETPITVGALDGNWREGTS